VKARSSVSRGVLAAILTLGLLSTTTTVTAAPPDGSQSPIDIRDEDVTFVRHLPHIQFRYPDASLEVINTGSPDPETTVRAIVNSPATIRVDHVTFTLQQFHFHTVSEHRLNGEEFPMELHLVHQASDGGQLVIGVFIKAGHQNRELQKIFRDLPADPTQTRMINHFDLDELIPHDKDTYRYTGSLTTPPFTEGVHWIVYDQPIEMSQGQIDAFKKLFPNGNSREPQPVNDRPIVSDGDGRHDGHDHGHS
jgi:carbonic anhydrase